MTTARLPAREVVAALLFAHLLNRFKSEEKKEHGAFNCSANQIKSM